MTGALFRAEDSVDLQAFFARLHECKDKNEHVHGLHPYPAKFIPHIPRALIRSLATEGDIVLDPMCGSGTALVEATVQGYDAIGVDLNPVATLVSRAKTTPLDEDERRELRDLALSLDRAASQLIDTCVSDLPVADDDLPVFTNRDKWFERHVVVELAYAKAAIQQLASAQARDLAFSALSSIIVAVSNQESETRWCAKPGATPWGTTLRKLAARVIDNLTRLAEYTRLSTGSAQVHTADARQLPLDDGSVGLVVTSPPYANSHDYYLYNKLRMFWLGYNVSEVQRQEIGSRNRHSDYKEGIETYTEAMTLVLSECRRVLRPGGTAAVVVADSIIRGEFFDMSAIYTELAHHAGLKLDAAHRFGHRQFNASFQRGFGTKGHKDTHVLILRDA